MRLHGPRNTTPPTTSAAPQAPAEEKKKRRAVFGFGRLFTRERFARRRAEASRAPQTQGAAFGSRRGRGIAAFGAVLGAMFAATAVGSAPTPEPAPAPPPAVVIEQEAPESFLDLSPMPPAPQEAAPPVFEPPAEPKPQRVEEVGAGSIELFYDPQGLGDLSPAEQNAQSVIDHLVQAEDFDATLTFFEDAKIIAKPLEPEARRLAERMGESIPLAPRETGVITLDADALTNIADHFAANHTPLDDLAGFAAPRGIEVPAEGMTPAFAGRYLDALSTREVLTDVRDELGAEQSRALQVVRHLNADEVAALSERLGVEARPGNDAWITNGLVDRFVGALHDRIIYLDDMGIETTRAVMGLGGGGIDAELSRLLASLPDLSRDVTNCALGRTESFAVYPIGIDRKNGNVEWLRHEAAVPFRQMFHEAPADLGLFPRSGFRSNAEQQSLQSTGLAAPVCTSNHEDGMSVDIGFVQGGVAYGLDSQSTAQYQWLAANAPARGIVNDVAHEPWHHTFVG